MNEIEDPVFALDSVGRCYFVNEAFTRLAGEKRGALLGKKTLDLLVDENGNGLQFRKGFDFPGEVIFRQGARDVRVLLAVHPIVDGTQFDGWIVRLSDIAAKAERKRLEYIGVMAGGVAHDLSNVISPIIMGIQFLHDAGTPEAVTLVKGIIEGAAHRGADILRQLLTCARGTSADFTQIDAGRLIIEAREQAVDNLHGRVKVETQGPGATSSIKGDPSQLRLMLICLLQAEIEAMSAEGSLTLRAENALLDGADRELPADAAPGSYIRFFVERECPETRELSSGQGPPAPSDRIPTTKAGIRLAMARAIAQNHQGFVLATTSTLGSEVYIPAAEPAPEHLDPDGEYPGHGETILVVDREPGLRRIIGTILQGAGYEVAVAADPVEIQGRDDLANKTFALVIANDVADAGQIRAFRAANPGSRCILVSKDAGAMKENKLSELGVEALLMKPCLTQDLLRTVRRVLDAPKRQEVTQ